MNARVQIIDQGGRGTDCGVEAPEQVKQMARDSGIHPDGHLVPGCAQSFIEGVDSRFPGQWLVRTRAALGLLDRSRDTVGIVQHLKTRLAPGTQFALVEGVIGIALELERPAVHDPGHNAASHWALAAGAGIPGGDASQLLLRWAYIGCQDDPGAR